MPPAFGDKMPNAKNRIDNLITKKLNVNGVDITASASEINALDGLTASVDELNIMDGVTASTAELNITDGVTATAAELNIAADKGAQTLTDDGAITNKNGVCLLNKAGVIAATLANPTATTDDYKILSILSLTAQAHTVTITGGFGNGGTGKDVATFAAAIGNGITVMAYQGYWYVIGANGVTLA